MREGAKSENLINVDSHGLTENQSVYKENLISSFDEITCLCDKGALTADDVFLDSP